MMLRQRVTNASDMTFVVRLRDVRQWSVKADKPSAAPAAIVWWEGGILPVLRRGDGIKAGTANFTLSTLDSLYSSQESGWKHEFCGVRAEGN